LELACLLICTLLAHIKQWFHDSWIIKYYYNSTPGNTSLMSVDLQLWLVSGWGLLKRRSAPLYGPLWLGKDFSILAFSLLPQQIVLNVNFHSVSTHNHWLAAELNYRMSSCVLSCCRTWFMRMASCCLALLTHSYSILYQQHPTFQRYVIVLSIFNADKCYLVYSIKLIRILCEDVMASSVVFFLCMYVDRDRTFLRLSSALVCFSCLISWWIKFARYVLVIIMQVGLRLSSFNMFSLFLVY